MREASHLPLMDRFLATGGAGASRVDEVEWVVKEVSRLMNTRSPLSTQQAMSGERRTVVDYGMADFVHISPLSRQATQRLASLIQSTVTAYEPRLHVLSVVVETPRSHRDELRAHIRGNVRRMDGSQQAVDFPLYVGRRGGAWRGGRLIS